MEKEFEHFFKEQQSRVYRVVLSYTHERATAEELTLEAMMRVYERWTRVRKFENPSAYLMRIAVNLAKRFFINRPKNQFVNGKAEVADHRHPENTVILKEENSRVERAMKRLSEKERQLIILKDVEGLKIREASETLGLRLSTAKSLYRRGKLKLAKILEVENA